MLRYDAMAGPSQFSGQVRPSILLVIDCTASAAIRALAGSYTPQGPSQWASASMKEGVFMTYANNRHHINVILCPDYIYLDN